MVETNSKIINTIISYVEDLKKQLDIKTVYIFGSYAKNTFDENSDLDIAIFTANNNELSTIDGIKILLKAARKHKNTCIEPILFKEDDKLTDNPFVKEILRTGIRVI